MRLFGLSASVVPVRASEYEKLKFTRDRYIQLAARHEQVLEEGRRLARRHRDLSESAARIAAGVDEAAHGADEAVDQVRVFRRRLEAAQDRLKDAASAIL